MSTEGDEAKAPPAVGSLAGTGPPSLFRQVTRSGFDAGEPELPPEKKPGSLLAGAHLDSPSFGPGVRIVAKIGGVTDPGGDKENQDALFMYESPDRRVVAVGVLDGHGRDLGRVASNAGKDCMLHHFQSGTIVAEIRENPTAAFNKLFLATHTAVREAFTQCYAKVGLTVKDSDRGYLLVGNGDDWNCVHGGTTATVCVLLDGRQLYTANVGDSTALMSGWEVTVNSDTALNVDRSAPSPSSGGGGLSAYGTAAAGAAAATAAGGGMFARGGASWDPVPLSVDHSPEEATEYKRVRSFRPCPHRGPGFPELLFVYDSFHHPKPMCNPIFREAASGSLEVTNMGTYYKNVRCEWASLVTTPAHSRFQDALAFTRSLGDFHLQTYGVSTTPDVTHVDLLEAKGRDRGPACIIVATDGVWDNWTYEDAVGQAKTFASAVIEPPNATDVAQDFMKLNYARAIQNFGKHADNMTLIVLYLFEQHSAPSGAVGGSAST